MRNVECGRDYGLSHSTLLSLYPPVLTGWKAKHCMSCTLQLKSKSNVSSDKQIHLHKTWKVKVRKRPGFWLFLLFLPASMVITTEGVPVAAPQGAAIASWVKYGAEDILFFFFCWMISDCKETVCH